MDDRPARRSNTLLAAKTAAAGGPCPTSEAASETEPTILLVDDDIELCELMQEFFSRHGIRLKAAHDGSGGLARALAGGYDLLLLDVMLPGLDGFELLRLVRRQSPVPVIMLTARTTPADRVAGLNAGADDYLPKPFGPEELLARIHAVLRRSGQAPRAAEVLEEGRVRLIPTAREALCEGTAVALTTVEYDILEFLVRAAGRIVSRDELTVALYQRRASPFDRAVDVHVSHLRKKLGRHGSLIRTVRGVGYLFRSGPEADEGP
jgi:two-component system, OmpR family, response regulator CpxR